MTATITPRSGGLMRRKKEPERTAHDQWVIHTASILGAIRRDGYAETSPLAAPFLTPSPILTYAPYDLFTWRSDGDGQYDVYYGSGVIGTASAAIRTANSRGRAEAALTETWRHSISGTAWVTSTHVHWQNTKGIFQWNWASYTSMALIGPGLLEIHGKSTTGDVNLRYQTGAAELILCLWAAHKHPKHPQAANLAWVPPHLYQEVQALIC